MAFEVEVGVDCIAHIVDMWRSTHWCASLRVRMWRRSGGGACCSRNPKGEAGRAQ
jgi:hypothetical protein